MLGQDTEFFLWDTVENKYVPSWHYLPPPTAKGGMAGRLIFRDGFAMEINSIPQSCRAYIWEDVASALKAARSLFQIPAHIEFSTRPYVDIREHLKDVDTWPQDLKVLGCHPTLDAYTGDRKEIRRDPLTIPFRTCGAHMHISEVHHVTQYTHTSQMFIKLCDLFIGLPLTVLFGDEMEFERRTLYGTAGEYRMQEYPSGARGIEYRTPSTRMYCHPAVMGLCFAIMRGLISKHFGKLMESWNPAIEKPLRKAINTGQGALEMFEDMQKMYNFADFTRPSVEDRLCGGFDLHSKYKLDCYGREYLVGEYQTIRPFSADVWLTLKKNINKDLNPEYPFREAHHGLSEYLAEWTKGTKTKELV
jgi:hypothetical protein